MTAEQFCLRWNNHQSTLVSVFDGLFESGTLVDCTLAADGQYLKAHKVVLSACSPYLEALLSQHYNQHPIVILKDVKFEELKAMLEYMYRGEVNVTQEQLGRFLKAAETLKIKGLTNNDVSSGMAKAAAMNAADSREMPAKLKQELRKSAPALSSVQPRSPVMGNQTPSLVETLKNAPASLVIDIPPISPVNSKEGSVSPTPRKRRKRKQSSIDDACSNYEVNEQVNSVVHSSNMEANDGVYSVDPLAVLETGIKQDVKQEEGDGDNGNVDIYESEGELMVDEDYDTNSRAGPSNGSSGAGDGAGWQGCASDGENAEPSKDYAVLGLSLHPRDRPYICNRCGRHYAVAYTLDRHQKYECGVDKQFQCSNCLRSFSRSDTLRVHMKNCTTKLQLKNCGLTNL